MNKDMHQMTTERTGLFVNDIQRARRALKVMEAKPWVHLCEQLMGLEGWKDVEYVSLYFYLDNTGIDIHLNADSKGSTIVRDIVRAGICHKMDKTQHWDEASLMVKGIVPDSEESDMGRVTIEVMGYVPETCKIVYKKVKVKAVKASTKMVAQIVCKPEDLT